jgi:hypothetical protein
MTSRHKLAKRLVLIKLPMVLSFLLIACATENPTGAVGGPPPPPRSGWHVSPSGTAGGSGSIGSPWNLGYALSGASGKIQPGDTVWLHGGTYRGAFVATVAGAPGLPVVIREYPGERATIDVAGSTSSTSRGDAFVVKGGWTVWWGFEMMSSDPNRSTNTRSNMMINNASNTKYINLVIHDGGIGFYTWAQQTNVEVNGSIFYNNGWQGPVQGGGHGMYLKSDAGPLTIKDNIMFNQFGYGVQVYSEPGDGGLVNITLDGNVSFNNSSISTQYNTSGNANILMGGVVPVQHGRVVNNMTYFSPGYGVQNFVMGFSTYANADATLQDNYAVGGSYTLAVGRWSQLTSRNNQLFGTSHVLQLKDTSLTGFTWQTNSYRRDPVAPAWQYNGTDYPFATWTLKTGLGLTDVTQPLNPTTPQVFVRPSAYEPGRATVVVYNWSRQSSVNVDLSGVLPSGASYEIHNVQDLFGAPVSSGTYTGGGVGVPMTGVAPPTPVGGAPHQPPRTGPDFDVFLVTKVN